MRLSPGLTIAWRYIGYPLRFFQSYLCNLLNDLIVWWLKYLSIASFKTTVDLICHLFGLRALLRLSIMSHGQGSHAGSDSSHMR